MNIKRKLSTMKQQMANVPEFFIKLTLFSITHCLVSTFCQC